MAFTFLKLGDGKTSEVIDYPSECPECHKLITPNYVYHRTKDNYKTLYLFLSCPNPKCQKCFSAEYNRYESAQFTTRFSLHKIIKGQPKEYGFSDEITNISPMFVKIYNEAFTAEQIDLLEIAGVGYRKAFEFLIKDYLINKNHDKKEEIKTMFLGKCINELVEDERIKNTAKRVVWLGNDQTHYIKKWEGKNLRDLKILIQLSINWIESEIMTNQIVEDMPE